MSDGIKGFYDTTLLDREKKTDCDFCVDVDVMKTV